jgi:GNAT superfamily N-acetyltransferase
MIKITPTSEEEVKNFADKEWKSQDIEHYGKDVEWKEEQIVFKAEENGEIVGSLSARYIGGVIYLLDLIVGGSHRRKGIGRELLKAVEQYAKDKAAHKIYLITGKDWESPKFYKSLGFEEVTVVPKHHFKKDFVMLHKMV